MRIKLFNNIAAGGTAVFNRPGYQVGADVDDPHGIVVRSKDLHSLDMSGSLLAIARAGVGVNTIPTEHCSEAGIVVFNTPAANANSVKELVIAAMLLSSRRIHEGLNWAAALRAGDDSVAKLVEQGKKQFAGPEISGKALGIIGLGAIGVMVANTAAALGMHVIGYDPYISIDSAWRLSRAIERCNDLKTLLNRSDWITIHVPFTKETENMIEQASTQQMKPGVRLLNFARPELVNEAALLKAIDDGIIERYVTDFPNERTVDHPRILAIPHLGASTPEAEENCAKMACNQLSDYLETGNITNSINFPACSMPPTKCTRLLIVNRNIPAMVGQVTAILAEQKTNIEEMTNRHRNGLAFTAIDVDGALLPDTIGRLRAIEGIIRVRVIDCNRPWGCSRRARWRRTTSLRRNRKRNRNIHRGHTAPLADMPYQCSSCGHRQPKWLGRCPECSEWNTMQEQLSSRRAVKAPPIVALKNIAVEHRQRRTTGSQEFDRVIGGGAVVGSSVLIGGEPGIGKSTLLLAIAAALSDQPALYVSGEESAAQIRERAHRLGCAATGLEVLCTNDIAALLAALADHHPKTLVIDSIQTLRDSEIGAIAGTPGQVRHCCSTLIEWCRMHDICLFLIAHVTKDGSIAGPKTMEHMVDTVLYFEQSGSDVRFLRAIKNRFGAVDEIGIFEMTATGLRQIADPNSLFVVQREGEIPPGIAAAAIYEGTRSFIVEIQALTVAAKGGISRVFSDRIDTSRVARVAAVLEKHVGISFSDQDIYVNVAGGIKIGEVGVELSIAHALYSARSGIAIPKETIMIGELSLAGEVRTVGHTRQRIKAARELGYRRYIGSALHKSETGWQGVADIRRSIAAVFETS